MLVTTSLGGDKASWDGSSAPVVGWPQCDYRWPVTRLRAIIIGTTNTCNASCIHCPTNKPLTRHFAREPMDWDLYRKLIDGLCDAGLPIDGDISFGLFAEPLIDPLLFGRLCYARERLPHVPQVVYSNGGAATAELGAAVRECVDHVAFHVEGVSAEVYDDLMRPLRAEHVFPRIEAFIKACPKPVYISCPISRRNVGEFAALKDYWLSSGTRGVNTQPLLNRSREKLGFSELSFEPVAVACGEDVVSHLLVDADGAVVVCYGDCEKRNIIGDLNRETVGETLSSRPAGRCSMLSRSASITSTPRAMTVVPTKGAANRRGCRRGRRTECVRTRAVVLRRGWVG